MQRTRKSLIPIVLVLLCACIGWWLGADLRDTFSHRKTGKSAPPADSQPHAAGPAHTRPPQPARLTGTDQFDDGTTVEILASANPGECILHFPSAEAYAAFAEVINDSNVTLVDQLDPLNAVRISYADPDDLGELLENENITVRNALSSVPDRSVTDDGIEPDAVGFGGELLTWLGIDEDNSQWGAGVRIAILDTGVVPHSALPPLADEINLVDPPADPADTNGHGTAVASIIASNNPFAPGIAPAAELISIRISGDKGVTDSFALAAGIVAAVDAGADIVNLSLGSYENSSLIRDAAALAVENDTLIVAAAGNDGLGDAAYPAAYPGVVSVGAIDARGQHLNFSNYGSYLYITAPGLAVNAAWPAEKFVRFSGTSASAPVVTAILAATMSDGSGRTLSAPDALDLMTKLADDAGIPGPDSEYGFGVVNIRRILNRNTPGIIDAAITDQRFVTTRLGTELQVTIQNRGTRTLPNTLLEVDTPVGTRQVNLTSLETGAIHTFQIPVNTSSIPSGTPFQITSTLTLHASAPDLIPEDNQRSDNFAAP
ncbi:MAG: S8 family peptidase [Verrucomicrobiales bacterium]